MKLKRGVWLAACLIGVIVCGGLAVLMGYIAFLTAEAGGQISGRGLVWPIGLLLIAGACAAGIFMSPREFHAATKTEVDAEPAQWIRDMRAAKKSDER